MHTQAELRRKARTLYPKSRRLAAKWVLAAEKLQQVQGGFLHEPGVPKPSWSYRGTNGA